MSEVGADLALVVRFVVLALSVSLRGLCGDFDQAFLVAQSICLILIPRTPSAFHVPPRH